MECQLLHDGARNLITPLGGLVRISRGSDGDIFSRLHFLQITTQQPGALLFCVDLALEIKPIVHFHELMGVACITVFARELASAIGIDGPSEWHAWRVTFVD